ncbi:hypothetical protein QE152_g15471 [Popillia japonica]|uniref:Uncharacterized protein n=1 Tax=Popillia japonica TaxID=7064 RepID=A0AAW1L9H3_POPJA
MSGLDDLDWIITTMRMMRRAAEDLNVTSDQNLDEFIKIYDNTPTKDDDLKTRLLHPVNTINDYIDTASLTEHVQATNTI